MHKGFGELDVAQLISLVMRGRAEILASDNTAIAIEFIDYPNYRVANVVATAGKSSPGGAEFLESFCKLRGAREIRGYCPKSVARLWKRYGYEQAYIVVRKPI